MTSGRLPPSLRTLHTPIFVDASAWLAAINERDQRHPEAGSLLEACLAKDIRLVTTNWTAFEALSMVKSRNGYRAANRLWNLVTDPVVVELIRVTTEIEDQALNLFFAYEDKTWGVVDCANLIVMEETGCRQAFGFDHHFVEASRQRGFEIIPGDS